MKWLTKMFIGGSGRVIRQSTLRNEEGLIVACLYVFHDGNLHPDSWLHTEGG